MPLRLAYSCQLLTADPRRHLFEFAPLHRNILPRLHPLSHIDHQGRLPPLAMALATFCGIGPEADRDATSIRQAAATCRGSGAKEADGSL
jgi:hypothetical protein